jgi:sterol 3beta-glucosyltransferase
LEKYKGGLMNICTLTIGTRGDVQPYIALGSGLMQGEQEVAIATLGEFLSRVSGHGSQHAALKGGFLESGSNARRISLSSTKYSMTGSFPGRLRSFIMAEPA